MDGVLPAPSTIGKQPAEAFIEDYDGDKYDDGRDSHADALIIDPSHDEADVSPTSAQLAQFELASGMIGSEPMTERFMHHVIDMAFGSDAPPLLFYAMPEKMDKLDEEDIHDLEAIFFNGEPHEPGTIEQTIIAGKRMLRIRKAVDWRTSVVIGREILSIARAGYHEQMLLTFTN